MELLITTRYFDDEKNKLFSEQNNELRKMFGRGLTEAGKKRNVYKFYYRYKLKKELTIDKIKTLKKIINSIQVIAEASLSDAEITIDLITKEVK